MKPSTSSFARAVLCALVLGLGGSALLSQGQAQDPAKKLAALEQRLQERYGELGPAYEAAETEDERKALLKKVADDFVPECLAIAAEVKGTDAAVPALALAIQLDVQFSDAAAAKKAFATMMADHAKSAAIEEFLGGLDQFAAELGVSEVEAGMRKVLADSPHRRVQASALFSLASVVGKNANGDAKRTAESTALFERLKKEFGDLSSGRETYAQLVDRTLFDVQHLQVGMMVPDFEAVDQDGAKFKLSDYKGKVTLIDFWGFW
jgi:hypothetical protein